METLAKMGIFARFLRQGSLQSFLRRGLSSGYLRDNYKCNEAWNKRLQSPLLQKVNTDDLFFEMDKKYQADKVLSAIDVDIYVNKVEDPEALDEMEELAYRLRKSPSTADSLPSTSHALIRALFKGNKTDDLLRILNDRLNYGIFVDFHLANILMDEFLKSGNHRDAVKVASLLMLEEDFGSPTSKFLCLVSCLKYLKDPSPQPWTADVEGEDAKEEKKVRLRDLRNVFFDQHFDLHESQHVLGKTLAKVGEVLEDVTVSLSAQLLGWGIYGRWDKVQVVLAKAGATKQPLYAEALKTVMELVEKALAEIESSPNKTLAKPKLRQFPGMNLEEKEVAAFWERIKYPAQEKFLPSIKTILDSNSLTTNSEDFLVKAESLLSSALSEHEEKEVAEQIKTYESWEKMRVAELEKQIRRFKAFKITEDIEAKKKELREKEETIFFFDNEEEWMMRLPPEEQTGFHLPTKYVASNSIKFVKVIPPKKNRKKKSKV